RYVISIGGGDRDALVSSLALHANRAEEPGAPIKRPRIALTNAPSSMDEGWTRWVLDQYGFDYTRLPGNEIETGNLRAKFDVILISDEGGGGGGRGGGQAPNVPARAKALDDFVRAGGTLVCFNRSANVIVDQLHLPVKNPLTGLNRTQF